MASLFSSKPSKGTSSIALLLFLSLLLLLLLHRFPSPSPQIPQNAPHFPSLFLSSAANHSLSSYLRRLTLFPHLAGTPQAASAASIVLSHFSSLGLETVQKDYNALLSYPVHSSLTAHFTNSTSKTLSLSDSSNSKVIPPFHAYAPSGSALGKALFVNYGREEDYLSLVARGVNPAGCVAVVRRGELSRHTVVAIAAAKGVAAVLMYTETKGFHNGVERGTVMRGLGDPLTPGWADVEGGERLEWEDDEVAGRFPKIPSMPVSEAVAEEILKTLGGAKLPFEWEGSMSVEGVKGVGPGPTVLNFTYQGEKKMATLHNIFAIIRGSEEPDRFVLLGNHRDAWTYGAVDPNSGTSALLDIARRFSLLKHSGWIPRRSIVFCSWDGEEFGMIGSTEWVEQNLLNLGSKAVAYLNVDCAVQGAGFFASATPQLDDLIIEVLKQVKDPDSEDMTVHTRWIATNKGVDIQRLSRADSDFAPFLHHAGVPSLDIYYGRDFPVYHTAFDSYDWMVNYGDPVFMRHVTVSNIWGLLALHLADDSILPLNYLSYATQLQVSEFDETESGAIRVCKEYTDAFSNLLEGNITLDPIYASIEELSTAAKEAQTEVLELMEQESIGNFSVLKKRVLNDRLMSVERGFLDSEGLKGRLWFKHLVYGPSRGDQDIKFEFFPGVVDAISESRRSDNTDHASIQHEIWRVARAIQRAAYALRGDLF